MTGWSRWVAAVVAVVALSAMAPANANATLVFVRGVIDPVVWAAADDGSAKHRIGPGRSPKVSPDGQTVAYLRTVSSRTFRSDLMIAPAARSTPRELLSGCADASIYDWSPDSASLAVLCGPELRPGRLLLIDVASGARRTLARGFFSGASFSPGGTELAYGRAAREGFPARTDVYRVASGGGGKPVRLTDDHGSLTPLWGPTGRIVFVKQLGSKKRRYGPKYELFLMDPDGGQVRRLTRTKVGPLLLGLTPTDWSADGSRLLAEFVGQDTSYAVTVNPRTGAQRPLRKAVERGLIGTALSADGERVLAATGGFEPEPNHDVVSVPYRGGRGTILARNAYEPDWSR